MQAKNINFIFANIFYNPVHKIILISILFLSGNLSTICFGQVISSAELKMMTVLNSGSNAIPKDLQLSKTIVIISMDDGNNNVRGDWKELAREAHFYINKLSIDAVLYFYVDDLIAGYDVKRSITEQIKKRDIKNILLLSKDKINGRDQYIGVVTPYNQKSTFISNNQPAWKSQTSDIEILFRNLARAIDLSNITLENLLIIDTPEFYKGVDIIRGRRSETFNTDLRIDKIAIPLFDKLPSPENTSAQSTAEMAAMIQKENEKNLSRNSNLEQIMANYPYKFEIVPYEYDEKKLLKKGFQFVLMRINSSGKNVKKLLGYDMGDDIKELITVTKDDSGVMSVKSIPIDGMVYKYYVKHINSGDIYLGEQWDGDDNWQDALNNHIKAIIVKLKKD